MKLDDYRECFNLSYDRFMARYNIRGDQIHENLRYEKIIEVSRVDVGVGEFFFFKDGELKMIYISNDALVKKLWAEFKSAAKADTPEKSVRSRAGKTSRQLIFASQGFTASVNNDEVDFIEIYPPCSLEEYLEKVYQERPPFIR